MWTIAVAWAGPLCGTPARLLHERPPPMAALPAPPPGALRDVYGVPNVIVGEHIALRWGDGDGALRQADLQQIADAFDDAWAVEVDEIGMPPPLGSGAYRLNVYVESGSNTPSAGGAAGYYWYDAQGWPMIVLSPEVVYDPEYGAPIAAHELFHALQDATGSYSYGDGDPAAWFWEATAEWATGEVYPGQEAYARLIGAFALYPHMALNHFDYPDEGTFIETYQYGAFLFPRYLSEQVLDPAAIRDAWVAPAAPQPLGALGAQLLDEGLAIREVAAAFYAHNAVWDYEDGEIYEALTDGWADAYSAQDFRIAEALSQNDADGGLRTPEPALLPGHLGANVLRLPRPPCGSLSATFDGDAAGSLGSDARWAGMLVVDGADGPTYRAVAPGAAAKIAIRDGARSVDLVVVPQSGTGWQAGEVFGYTYALTLSPAADGDPDCSVSSGGSSGVGIVDASTAGFSPRAGEGGCACRQGTGPRGLWVPIALMLWRGRRRR